MSKEKEVKEEKEDIRHTVIFCINSICLVLIIGLTICANTYIHAVYQLESTKSRNLRFSY